MLLFLIGCFQVDGEAWKEWSDSTSTPVDTTVVFQQEAAITSNEEVGTGVELTCSASGVDGSGNVLEPTYSWTKGTVELSNQNTYIVDADETDVGDTITCIATITNANGNIATSEDTATISNTDPVITDVEITPDPSYNDSSLTCLADISDPDEELEAEYSWQIGGEQFSTNATVELVQYANLEIMPTQQIDCVATVSDSEGAEDSNSTTITIGNRDPLVENIRLSANSFEANAEVSCAADISDPDGEETTVSYSWTMDGIDLGITVSSISLTPELAPVDGELACIVSAEDGYGGVGSETGTQAVVNTLPSVDSVAITPNTGVYADSELVCSATGSDLNDGELIPYYVWMNGSTQLGTGDSLSLDSSIASPNDTITCTASVTDENGDSSSLSADVTVGNTPPVVFNVVVSSGGTVYTGTQLSCSAEATDYNDGNISTFLSYEWSVNGNSIGTGATYIVNASETDVGDNIVCTASVTDSNGATHQEIADVAIENTAPVMSGFPLVSNSSPEIGDNITCSAMATDIDEDTINYTYQWFDTNGAFLGSSDSFLVSDLDVGEQFVCEVIPDDGMNSGASSTSSFVTVANTPPEVTEISISPDTETYANTTYTCLAVGSDVNDGELTPSYVWTNGGNILGTSDSLTLDSSIAAPDDIITCTASVTDDNGETAELIGNIMVLNTPPVVSNVAISSNSGVYTGAELTCSAEATDYDDGDIGSSLSYEWSANGVVVGSGATYIVDASETDVGDNIVCTASVTDSNGGTHHEIADVAIENTAPYLLYDPIISNTSPEVGETITCAFEGDDIDQDSVTYGYSWTDGSYALLDFGDGLITTDPVELVVPNLSVGEIIYCDVIPNDGTDTGNPRTSSATIANTAPEIISVEISPNTGVTTSSLLSCLATATDINDGDLTSSVSYSWTSSNGGSLVGDSWHLDNLNFAPNDTVTCIAEVTDQNGATVSSPSDPVTIENSDPIISNLQIFSQDGDAFTASELNCSASASDPDEGDIGSSLTYEWFLSGSSISLGSGPSYIVDALETNVGDDVVCTASVADSLGATVSDTTSIIIQNTAPIINSVQISSSSGNHYNDEVLDCVVTAEDIDGTIPTFNYSWWFDGANVGGSSTLDLSLLSIFPYDSVDCEVEVLDGQDSVIGDDTVSIGNRAPTDPTATISWSGSGPAPSTVDDLTCTGEGAVDPDGQPINYVINWISSFGQIFSGSPTLSFTQTFPSEEWECQVVVSDGTAVGFASDTVSIISSDWDFCPNTQTLSNASYQFIGEGQGQRGGNKVTSAGDVDGDGLEDLLVAAFFNSDIGHYSGKVYLFFGASLTEGTINLSQADYAFTGEGAQAWLGLDVHPAGDVDGDGFDDIMMSSQVDSGRTYLFLGSSILAESDTVIPSANADYIFNPENTDDSTNALASADIDNDGLSDIIIGGRTADPHGQPDGGIVYIVLGSSLGNSSAISLTNADYVLYGEASGDEAGVYVASAGDVDNDGLDDILVGAHYSDPFGITDAGRTYLVMGSSIINSTASMPIELALSDYVFMGEGSGDWVGDAFSAGDVDGDGLNDILIGTDQHNLNGYNDVGEAYLFLASSLGNTTQLSMSDADYIFSGLTLGQSIGDNVNNDGDIDGDGLADIVISAHYTSTGTAYVFLGGSLGLDGTLDIDDADFYLTGDAAGEYAYILNRVSGDYNGDGLDDLIFSSTANAQNGVDAGKTAIFTPCEYINDPPTEPEISITWTSGGTYLAPNDDITCSATGSIDPQGLNVSYSYEWTSSTGATVSGQTVLASNTSMGETWTCTVTASDGAETAVVNREVTLYSSFWEYCDSSQALNDAQYQFTGEADDDAAGYAISSAGDVDGDGLDDVLISAIYNSDGGGEAGKVYLFLGSSLTSGAVVDVSTADYTIIGLEVTGEFGREVGSAGDVDGDGLDDFLISEVATVNGYSNTGKVYLFLGSSILAGSSNLNTNDADYIFTGESSADYAIALSSAGDVDGDGLSDILIGAMKHDSGGSTDIGKAYLILGASLGSPATISLSNADYAFTGENGTDEAGVSVSTAGDVDGDGLSDILIGARYNSDVGTQSGKAYLIFGSSLGGSSLGNSSSVSLSQADYSFIGEEGGDLAGHNVSGGQDVDGDGLDDILIGARHGDGLLDSGKAYLILASSLGSNTAIDLGAADYRFTGASAEDWAGYNVSLIGDVEGDGLSDILISASRNDDVALNAGKSYLFLASSLGAVLDINLANADYTFSGENTDDQAAILSKTVGDINGDGRSDIFIGSPNHDPSNLSDAGKIGIFTACDYIEYPPTAPDVAISWTSGAYPIQNSDDLVCSASGSVDPNGGSVSYTYSWESEAGVVVSGDTVSSSQTSLYEQWTCTVTADDGYVTTSVSEFVSVGCGLTDCDENIDLGNGITIDMVTITSGVEPMGRYSLSSDFDIMTTLVTQGMYLTMMGYQSYAGEGVSGASSGDNYPAYEVNWHMAADFSNQLTAEYNSMMQTNFAECYTCQSSGTLGVTCVDAMDPYVCDGFRLPTEAEWEYAARSGSPEEYWTPNGGGPYSANDCTGTETIEDGSQNPPLLGDYVWYCGNNDGSGGPPEVALKLPNGFGLYDMHGLVYEWTGDWYDYWSGAEYPNQSIDPYNSVASTERVMHGGFWAFNAVNTKVSYRAGIEPADRSSINGFRLVKGR